MLAGPGRVLDGHEVRMGPGGPGGRQLEHAGPEGRQHAPLRRDRRGQRVEGVEIRHHLGIGPRVVGDGDTVAGADPEEEAPGKALLQRGDGRPDVLGRPGPDADDAAGHRHVVGRGQQLLEVRREPGVEAARGPQRPVAEGLELGGDAAPGIVGVPPRAAPPHADATEVHARHRTGRAPFGAAWTTGAPTVSRGASRRAAVPPRKACGRRVGERQIPGGGHGPLHREEGMVRREEDPAHAREESMKETSAGSMYLAR